MSKTIVIGAKGQLGSDIMRAAQDHQEQRVGGVDFPQIDVRDAHGIDTLLNDERPDTVINLAAYHDVDRCEETPEDAFAVNTIAAYKLARSCELNGTRLIHFSTDYVFHETPEAEPLNETARPNPQSVYAASKYAGENLIRAYCENSVIIRTCGLYGQTPPNGKAYNFPLIMLKMAREGRPIKVVADQICTPTWTQPLAQLVLELAVHDLTGIVHATCQGQCSWYSFTQALFELAGLQADLTPVTTREYGSVAVRPPYSVLDNARLRAAGLDRLPHWRDALAGYLATISG